MAVEFLVGSSIMESGCEVGVNVQTKFPCADPVKVYAVWDSNEGCGRSTPSSTFIWYYWNGTAWVEFARGTPGIFQGYVYWWINISNGCGFKYKVTFAGMSAEFQIGEVVTTPSITIDDAGFDPGMYSRTDCMVPVGQGIPFYVKASFPATINAKAILYYLKNSVRNVGVSPLREVPAGSWTFRWAQSDQLAESGYTYVLEAAGIYDSNDRELAFRTW